MLSREIHTPLDPSKNTYTRTIAKREKPLLSRQLYFVKKRKVRSHSPLQQAFHTRAGSQKSRPTNRWDEATALAVVAKSLLAAFQFFRIPLIRSGLLLFSTHCDLYGAVFLFFSRKSANPGSNFWLKGKLLYIRDPRETASIFNFGIGEFQNDWWRILTSRLLMPS